MPILLGLHSPKIEAAYALRARKERREQKRFLIEGPTMLEEAMRSGALPEAVYTTQAHVEEVELLLGDARIPVYIVPERAMTRLSDLQTSPGIVAVAPMRLQSLEALLSDGAPLALLAGISDPGNAGTLLRSAEIFGMGGVLFGAEGIEAYNPKVVRASMGSIFRLRLATVNPHELAANAHAHGYTLIGASRSGIPLPSFPWVERPIIAIGNERHGVHSWLSTWDQEVSIPQLGDAESLNAAVAGSIILYAYATNARALAL